MKANKDNCTYIKEQRQVYLFVQHIPQAVEFPTHPNCLTVPGKVSAMLTGKKFVTFAGGCAPEASTLPPVTVSQIF